MTISETIRSELQKKLDQGVTVYAISKATGVDQAIAARFIRGERKQIRSETIDKLCAYLGLELQPIKGNQTERARASAPTSAKSKTKRAKPTPAVPEVSGAESHHSSAKTTKDAAVRTAKGKKAVSKKSPR